MLRFSILGEILGWRGDEPLGLGPAQRRAVLSVLLVRRGEPVGVGDIVDAVWGDHGPAGAVGTVRTHIANLRRTLEPDRAARQPPSVLASVGKNYVLRLSAGCVDAEIAAEHVQRADRARRGGDHAEAREQLRAALALWRGPALAGITGPFADRHRSRLEQLRLCALEARLDLDLELGDHDAVLAELTALVAEHPLRERFSAQLMTALYRCGRQSEALEVHAALRRTLVAELGVEPGPEIAAVHEQILRAELPTRAVEVGRIAERTPRLDRHAIATPAQLPAEVADFTGRADIVRELAAHFDDAASGAVVISAVAGMGGVGKSTLAVHIAHRIRDRFPDGQLYVNLRGVEPDPAAPVDVLAGFLRALGIREAELPPSVDERSALLRTVLADRRVLLVLDNARDTDQVLPLIPGTASTAVLITSRAVLTELPGARPIRLDVLDPDEALELFTRIIGPRRAAAEPEATRAAIEICGRLPLALRVLGSRLLSRPGWTIAGVTARLADEEQRLDLLRTGDLAVAGVFRLGYDWLTPDQARAFRLLARTGVPDIPLAAAAAVLELSSAQTEQLCESLVDLNLLETAVPGRYRYHDLLRLFAQRLDGPTGDEAMPRTLDFYLATVKNLITIWNRGSMLPDHLCVTRSPGLPVPDIATAQRWLDRERANLVWLFTRAGRRDDTRRMAADIAWALGEAIDTGSHAWDLLSGLLSLLSDSESAGDDACTARVHVGIGTLQTVALAQMRQARRHLDAAAAKARDTEPRLAAFAAVVAIYRNRLSGHHPLGWSDADLALIEGTGDPWLISLGKSAFTSVCTTIGDYEQAYVFGEQALRAAESVGDPVGASLALHELGLVLSLLGDDERAVELCEKAFELAEPSGLPLRVGWAQATLARAYASVGRFADAEPHAAAALRCLTDSADTFHTVTMSMMYAMILRTLGRNVEAKQVESQGATLAEELDLVPSVDAHLDRRFARIVPGARRC